MDCRRRVIYEFTAQNSLVMAASASTESVLGRAIVLALKKKAGVIQVFSIKPIVSDRRYSEGNA